MFADTLDDTAELCLIRSAGELFHLVRDGVLLTDVTPRILAVNSAFSRITGYAERDVKGLNPNFLKSGRHAPDFYRRLWQKLIEEGHWHGEIWNRRQNGEEYLALLTIRAIRNAQGEALGYLVSLATRVRRSGNRSWRPPSTRPRTPRAPRPSFLRI